MNGERPGESRVLHHFIGWLPIELVEDSLGEPELQTNSVVAVGQRSRRVANARSLYGCGDVRPEIWEDLIDAEILAYRCVREDRLRLSR